MRDRLARLRHDAVVGGDDEHRDVGDLRAAGAHGGERLVARRVEEGDPPAVDLGLVGADVLRDPAGLGLDDGGLADRVEQRRLAVVDVAHDRDDRRAVLERLLRRRRTTPARRSSSPACLIVTSRSSSAAISSTSSSVSDWVAVFIWPRSISILMICGIEIPSACEKSRSVTPDSTVTGPVGGDDLARRLRAGGRSGGRPAAGAGPRRDGRRRPRSRRGASGSPGRRRLLV